MAGNGMSARWGRQSRWPRSAMSRRRWTMRANMRRAAAGASSSILPEPAPRRIGVRDLFDMARAAVSAWSSDYAPSMGAALSYYTVFSIARLVYGEDAARGAVFYQVRGMMGDAAAVALQGLLASVHKPGQSIVAATVGL